MEVLLLTAPLKERIWGGDYFKKLGRTDHELIGEMWSASAHPEGESVIINGKLKGMSLSKVYKTYPELFNYPKLKEFPVLVKLIDAKDALSVQVHPDDEYALKYENQYGKTEGWLILNRTPGANIVVGHKATNEEDLRNYIKEDNYEELLQKVSVNPGEFYPIYAGTIHAIGAGVTILEIQQSSDVTYRFYDYHRKDLQGKERELHVEKAISVSTYGLTEVDTTNHFELPSHQMWENKYFSVSMLKVLNEETFKNPENYSIITVVEGEFNLNGYQLVLGDSFILAKKANQIKIKGDGILVRTDVKS